MGIKKLLKRLNEPNIRKSIRRTDATGRTRFVTEKSSPRLDTRMNSSAMPMPINQPQPGSAQSNGKGLVPHYDLIRIPLIKSIVDGALLVLGGLGVTGPIRILDLKPNIEVFDGAGIAFMIIGGVTVYVKSYSLENLPGTKGLNIVSNICLIAVGSIGLTLYAGYVHELTSWQVLAVAFCLWPTFTFADWIFFRNYSILDQFMRPDPVVIVRESGAIIRDEEEKSGRLMVEAVDKNGVGHDYQVVPWDREKEATVMTAEKVIDVAVRCKQSEYVWNSRNLGMSGSTHMILTEYWVSKGFLRKEAMGKNSNRYTVVPRGKFIIDCLADGKYRRV